MSRKVDAAVAYARKGFSVFPLYTCSGGACSCWKGRDCTSAGKHPLTTNGFKDSTTDEAKIRVWWQKWPDANIGLTLPHGIVAIDVDGDDGRDWLIEQF